MKTYVKVLTTLVLSLLVGCAADTSLPSEFVMKDVGNDGIVVMSITNNHAKFMGAENSFAPKLYIQSIETDFQTEVEGHRGTWYDKHLKSGSWPIGRIVAIKLPPGKYEIYGWTTNAPVFGGHLFVASESKPYIYFESEIQRILYAGNLDLHIDSKADTYELVVSDEQERDIAEFRKKWPSLCDETIDVKLAVRLQDFIQEENEPDNMLVSNIGVERTR